MPLNGISFASAVCVSSGPAVCNAFVLPCNFQIDRASAANIKRSKEEAAADPDEEDDFGYTNSESGFFFFIFAHSYK